MSDDPTAQQRRFLLLVVGAVVLIGLVGGTIALLSGGGKNDSGTGTKSTRGSEVPTAATLCNAAQLTTYRVAPGGKVRPAATSAAAAAPWGTVLTSSTTTESGVTTALMAIGKPGKPPHEVLTVTQGKDGWLITANSACLDLLGTSANCAATSLKVGGTVFRDDTATAPEPGAFAAQGTMNFCGDVANTTYVNRGALAPVSTYAATGPRTAVVVADGKPVLFSR